MVKSLDSDCLELHKPNDEDKCGLTQHVRISPQKQFIVQTCCTTQNVSPKDSARLHKARVPLKEKNNLILEQEDYLLPVNASNECTEFLEEYSLTKEQLKPQAIHEY